VTAPDRRLPALAALNNLLEPTPEVEPLPAPAAVISAPPPALLDIEHIFSGGED
jgi:hypothetical protein